MSFRHSLSLRRIGSGIGLVLLWVATSTWLLIGGAFAGYLLLASAAVGGLLLLAVLLTWLAGVRQGLRWLASLNNQVGYKAKRWLEGTCLSFVLSQLLVAVWSVYQLLG